MPIINSIFSWINIKRMSQIELMKKYPVNVQTDSFKKLILKAANTTWGKKYNYSQIQSFNDFNKAVPIQDYENIKPYVNRIREGEKDLLWPGEIKWFAKSSGTTSDKSKFIPVSRESLEDCHFRAGKDVLAIYTSLFPETLIFKGKSLALGGSHKINNFNNESFYGDLSAVLIQNIPFWAEFFRTPGPEIALMDEWEEKIELMAKNTIFENVTSLAGVPSWTGVLLKRILEISNKQCIKDIWPNLELFIHGGVSFEPYRQQFKNIINDERMNYMETYNASEGFFAIQDDLSQKGMLLMLDLGIFYEFIPIEELDKTNPTVLTIGEVEKEKIYAMVISTNGGLWRYLIGDTIKFVSLFPHRIVITGRTKHFINAFGEELMIDNAEQALKIACERTNALINEYTAAPYFINKEAKGFHKWIFDFEKQPESIELFMEILDNALKNLNSDYEAKRYKNMALTPPQHYIVKANSFYQWLKNKGKLGGQHKVPRLMNNNNISEEIIKISESL